MEQQNTTEIADITEWY